MLTQKGALTLSELSSQGDVWKQVIQTVDKEQAKMGVESLVQQLYNINALD